MTDPNLPARHSANAPTPQLANSPIVQALTRPYIVVLAVLAMISVVASVELGLGREPMCTCGFVSLWHGPVDSQNSQQISDWYSFTHVLHGIAFYALLVLVANRLPVPVRLLLAVFIEGAWEIAENSPFIIDRYRTATISLDYYGDSVVNSVSDVFAMILGFVMARRLPVWATIGFVIAVEGLLAVAIRDNLTLNIIMLIHPFEAIKRWQLG
ncbi:MAG TPA: DUF2585 domain-containing protein [Vicinamibacterales bacterium]|nr:DUF2585 domain-containing protein [Vicinamibacterales bacterium]